MEWTCSTCGQRFEPAAWMVKKSQRTCSPCLLTYHRAYRLKRKQQGNPVVSGKPLSREHARRKSARYRERPGVRAHLAWKAQLRRQNPMEQAKAASRRLLRSALEMGKMIREPCEVCGSTPADAHHDDYLQPLDVRWLCRLHHYHQHKAAKETG